MNLNELKELYGLNVKNIYTIEALREIRESIENEEEDFIIEIEGMELRFIHENYIDEIMTDELSQDDYILGCFNAWFLADLLDVELCIIEELQKKECYEAIGKWIKSNDLMDDLQYEYKKSDGYGHHFAGYDFEDIEIENYHIFRIN